MKQKALINFAKYNSSVIITIITALITGMTGNIFYVSPLPSIAALQAALDAYAAALNDAQTRDRVKIGLKNSTRLTLNDLAKQMAMYINSVAVNDIDKLLSSAAPLSKIPEPRHLEVPGAPMISQGISTGSLVCKLAKVAGANSYMFQILELNAPAGTEWTSFNTTRVSYTFDKLTPGVGYKIRVIAVGSNNQVSNSITVTFYAQ